MDWAAGRPEDVTPQRIRAEVWMSICGGTTGIGYFTHVWKPSYKTFGVPAENREALRKINEQITRLTPAILAPAAKERVSVAAGEVKVALLAKQHEGQRYLFAVNYDGRMKKTTATVNIDGLPDGAEVTVIDESRTIRSRPGSFQDVFEPLAVHVYRIPWLR